MRTLISGRIRHSILIAVFTLLFVLGAVIKASTECVPPGFQFWPLLAAYLSVAGLAALILFFAFFRRNYACLLIARVYAVIFVLKLVLTATASLLFRLHWAPPETDPLPGTKLYKALTILALTVWGLIELIRINAAAPEAAAQAEQSQNTSETETCLLNGQSGAVEPPS